MLLKVGETCETIAEAGRAAVLIDVAHYFRAAKSAMGAARRSIFLLGWDFDPRTLLAPMTQIPRDDMVLGPFLNQLKAARPHLDIRILIWSMALPIAAGHEFFPHRSRLWLDRAIHFHLDRTSPYGSSRHEKILVIDDAVAFCGGSDFTRDRLDIRSHPDRTPWRRLPSGERYPPRHDAMICVDGPAARALGVQARERWLTATGERLSPPGQAEDSTPWPQDLAPDFSPVPVAIVRSMGAQAKRPALRHNETLYLDAIGAARHLIYLENQYFTAAPIREALAARLAERVGPQIILVCTAHSPSYFDRATMDSARDVFVARLKAADAHGRLRVYAPHTDKGRPIIMHSKLAVIDDRLLRIGSSNLNNRSAGYDTETDLAIETAQPDARIAGIRHTLIAHFFGWTGAAFAAEEARRGSPVAALDVIEAAGRRLLPYAPQPLGCVARFVAAWHLGDPSDVSNAWRPWRRGKDQAVMAMSTMSGR